ncbi:MAG: hypothetical protein G3M70_11205 [Candidatus Nitronauta litoralis]|uniref:Uncharacterized protein n=1 Tax=Candidatus Nitronauta litoralis TaxID=2705533 RepID=A0A7T0G0C5_9BACT|nr:MAG: hypothetical protein G3M70_11205 [Candidatus Nitronauta litoralis]
MKKQTPLKVSVKTGEVRIKGHGSSAIANQKANSVSKGLEHAVRKMFHGQGLRGNLHLEKVKVRIPQDANDQQISSLFEKALEDSMQTDGGRHG